MTNDAILAWGGGTEDCSSQATIDYMKGLGMSEFHNVSANLDPRKDICDRLIANGIFPVYDVEGALWAGSFSAADISWAIPQLNNIKYAGWKGFSSEGLFGSNVEIIRKILPFVNYGDENGAEMIGGYYSHWAGQHTANYMECYHKQALEAYKNTSLLNNKDTPHEMGLCWMMYPQTADLEMDTAAMQQFLTWGEQNGITWRAFLFWAGEQDCPTYKLKDGEFMPLLNMIKNRYNIVKRTAWNQFVTPPPPPPPVVAADNFTLGFHAIDPNNKRATLVGQTTATGKPAAHNQVNFQRSPIRGGKTVYIGSATSDDGGNFSMTVPLLKGSNFVWAVLSTNKAGRWTTDNIWI